MTQPKKPRQQRPRPYPLIPETDEYRSLPSLPQRPRLRARWVIGLEGQLSCRWEEA